MMSFLYSYVLRYDDGAAPNPFWNVCTLTICKPKIRRKAVPGDWVIGTGSVNSRCNDGRIHDLSRQLVYAMKVTQRFSLPDYDRHCRQHLPEKIPVKRDPDWRRRMGDCIYDYSRGETPAMRPGVHNEGNRDTDLSGENALLSTHFYYFGEQPIPLPTAFLPFVVKQRGHKKITSHDSIREFEAWISDFPLNVVSGEPQLKHRFDGPPQDEQLAQCGICQLTEDTIDDEEIVC